MENIIITGRNLVDSQAKNQYRFEFPSNVITTNKQVAVSSINIFYSWFNITSVYDNHTYSYTYPNGATTTTYNVSIPNGNYSISDIESYFNFISVQNKTYLIDANGQNVYYLHCLANQPRYAVQINCDPLPLVLPTGWTIPAGGPALPTSNTNATPQLIVLGGLGKYIGFNDGSYPASPNTLGLSVGFLGQKSPNVSPVSSIFLLCDLTYNSYSSSTGTLLSFTPQNVNFGANIYIVSPEFNWNNLSNGIKNEFSISFTDQFNNPLYLNDTDICVNLVIRDKPDN
jgi:hypothetical protein